MAVLAPQARLSDDERRVLHTWLTRLRQEIELDAVWLFGSRARGEAGGEDSDVDLLVITRGDPGKDRHRVWALVDEAADELGADPTVFVPHVRDRAWLDDRRRIDSFFIQEVDRDRVILFERS